MHALQGAGKMNIAKRVEVKDVMNLVNKEYKYLVKSRGLKKSEETMDKARVRVMELAIRLLEENNG